MKVRSLDQSHEFAAQPKDSPIQDTSHSGQYYE